VKARLATVFLLLPAVLLLGCAFLLPLLRLAGMSVASPGGPFAAYAALLGEPVYRRVFSNTMVYALLVTVIGVAAGYLIAFALTRLSPLPRAILFFAVLMPLWISVLVRSFAWILLLERNGPINRLLMGAGLLDAPLPMLFNSFAVVLGMVHLLIPYAVLPIYAALVRIDPALLRASSGLGAGALRSFLKVLLPLSAQGVATAGSFLLLLSLGFFVTPALLGGAADTTLAMLIDSFVNERLDWPLAGAASMVLLAGTLALLAILGRFVTPATIAEAR
jgi:ABC-type spermidine/putrescine transport system permease subunit I